VKEAIVKSFNYLVLALVAVQLWI